MSRPSALSRLRSPPTKRCSLRKQRAFASSVRVEPTASSSVARVLLKTVAAAPSSISMSRVLRVSPRSTCIAAASPTWSVHPSIHRPPCSPSRRARAAVERRPSSRRALRRRPPVQPPRGAACSRLRSLRRWLPRARSSRRRPLQCAVFAVGRGRASRARRAFAPSRPPSRPPRRRPPRPSPPHRPRAPHRLTRRGIVPTPLQRRPLRRWICRAPPRTAIATTLCSALIWRR
mmetsp:Transcript_17913/g.53832  ORF Transcript_17913/g.53832 Transcript_17913/m.53832 type:complete len:232 (+) Transcript_17913:365-1060(+)